MPRNSFKAVHGAARRGSKKSRTYRAWESMRARCNDARRANYRYYGGRGIKVCARWDSFESFLEDMGECLAGMSLERNEVDGHYEPANCRWATLEEQSNNKRTSRRIEFRGRVQNLKRWCDELALDYHATYDRLHDGWSAERAFTVPVRVTRRAAP